MEYREKNQIERKDFMELLIQLKNKGKLDHVDDIQNKNFEGGQDQINNLDDEGILKYIFNP